MRELCRNICQSPLLITSLPPPDESVEDANFLVMVVRSAFLT